MNLKTKLILICVCLFFLSIQITAQKDSIQIEESTEIITKSDFKKKKEYKYFDPKFRKEKTLIKLGLPPLGFFAKTEENNTSMFDDMCIVLSVERKISQPLSIIVNTNYENHGNHYQKQQGQFVQYYDFKFSNSVGLRFYYALNRQIRELKGANNFHSNYFAFELDGLITFEDEMKMYSNWLSQEPYELNADEVYFSENIAWTYRPYLKLSWGMQRRIGNWGYIDGGTYLKFNDTSFGFGIDLLVGLGLGF